MISTPGLLQPLFIVPKQQHILVTKRKVSGQKKSESNTVFLPPLKNLPCTTSQLADEDFGTQSQCRNLERLISFPMTEIKFEERHLDLFELRHDTCYFGYGNLQLVSMHACMAGCVDGTLRRFLMLRSIKEKVTAYPASTKLYNLVLGNWQMNSEAYHLAQTRVSRHYYKCKSWCKII